MQTQIRVGLLGFSRRTIITLATVTSSGYFVPVFVVHFRSVRPDKLLTQLGGGGHVWHKFGDKYAIQPELLCVPFSRPCCKIEDETVIFLAENGSKVGLGEKS